MTLSWNSFLHSLNVEGSLDLLSPRECSRRAKWFLVFTLEASQLLLLSFWKVSAILWKRLWSSSSSSVSQSCSTLCNPMNRSTPGLPTINNSQSSLKLISIESVMPSRHLILCHPLLLLPPIPSSIRVFSNESTLCMRWPKYWSFSLSISHSNEHPGLIYARLDWLDPLAV